MDGKDTGRITPAMVPVDHLGGHTFLVRKQGYLDETATATVQAGQTFQFAPVLHALGNTDDIKMVGKFKKMFGGGETAGMGIVSVKTQPKGAQIASQPPHTRQGVAGRVLPESGFLRDRYHRERA